jgi:hypothetical protein
VVRRGSDVDCVDLTALGPASRPRVSTPDDELVGSTLKVARFPGAAMPVKEWVGDIQRSRGARCGGGAGREAQLGEASHVARVISSANVGRRLGSRHRLASSHFDPNNLGRSSSQCPTGRLPLVESHASVVPYRFTRQADPCQLRDREEHLGLDWIVLAIHVPPIHAL